MSGNENNPIYPLLSKWIRTWTEPEEPISEKLPKWHFLATSNEIIWPQKNSDFMHGLKSAILAIFQKSADWLDWPCPSS